MRVDLNKSESVTVILKSRGGGIIWIRSYGDRSPLDVVYLCLPRLNGRHRQALREHATCTADSSAKTYSECISWAGG